MQVARVLCDHWNHLFPLGRVGGHLYQQPGTRRTGIEGWSHHGANDATRLHVRQATSAADVCEHMFDTVGHAGSAYARLRRSLATGNATLAWAAAAELQRVPLQDALVLLLLVVREDRDRFERAAVRWLGRACLDLRGLSLGEAQLLAAALANLDDARAAGAVALAEICNRHGLGEAVAALDRFSE